MSTFSVFSCISSLFLAGFVDAKGAPNFRQLVLEPQSYDNSVSPYEFDRKTIYVHYTIPFLVLLSVVEDKQTVSYNVNINVTWFDSRLKFSRKEYMDDFAIVPSKLIWVPRLSVFNGIDVVHPDQESDSHEVRIYPSGWVNLKFAARYETVCQCDVSRFPFDTQYCSVNFDAGLYTIDRMVLIPHANTPYSLVGTSEWQMLSQTARTINYEDLGLNYSSVQITTKLKRNPQFYMIFLVTPTLVISITCFAALLLPLNLSTTDRINLGLTSFLGLTFMLSIVVLQIPRSTKIPLLGGWLMLEMFFCAAAIFSDYPINAIKRQIIERCLKKKKSKLTCHIVDSVAFVIFLSFNIFLTVFWFLSASRTEDTYEPRMM